MAVIERARSPLRPAEIARLLRRAGDCVGAWEGEVGILFTGDAEIRRLNRTFRGKDRPTDVLAFPDGRAEITFPARLGDIAVSIPGAGRNARRAGHSLRREVSVLLVHGFLHLAGYDHEVDGGEMSDLEADLHRRLLPKSRSGRG